MNLSRGYVCAIAFAAAAIFCIIYGCVSIGKVNKTFASYGQAEAVVVKCSEHKNYHDVTYEYKVGEEILTYRNMFETSFDGYVGEHIKGYYDKNDPEKFYPKKNIGSGIAFIVGSLFFVLLAVGALIEENMYDNKEKAKGLHQIINGLLLLDAGMTMGFAFSFADKIYNLFLIMLVGGALLIVRGVFLLIDERKKYSDY